MGSPRRRGGSSAGAGGGVVSTGSGRRGGNRRNRRAGALPREVEGTRLVVVAEQQMTVRRIVGERPPILAPDGSVHELVAFPGKNLRYRCDVTNVGNSVAAIRLADDPPWWDVVKPPRSHELVRGMPAPADQEERGQDDNRGLYALIVYERAARAPSPPTSPSTRWPSPPPRPRPTRRRGRPFPAVCWSYRRGRVSTSRTASPADSPCRDTPSTGGT